MEATFPETAATLVGPNLKPRILVPASASDAARFEFYQKVIEEAGGVFEEERVNIVGIRGVKVDSEKGSGIELSQTASAGEFAAYKAAEKKQKASGPKPQHFSGRAEQGGGEKGTGRWDDVVVSLWLERDGDGNVVKHNVKERIGSVDPAGDNTKWGTAHVRDGQYLYKRGHHNTKQKKPHGKAVKKKFAKSETVKVRQSAGNRKKTHYQYDALVLAGKVEVWRDKGRGEETPTATAPSPPTATAPTSATKTTPTPPKATKPTPINRPGAPSETFVYGKHLNDHTLWGCYSRAKGWIPKAKDADCPNAPTSTPKRAEEWYITASDGRVLPRPNCRGPKKVDFELTTAEAKRLVTNAIGEITGETALLQNVEDRKFKAHPPRRRLSSWAARESPTHLSTWASRHSPTHPCFQDRPMQTGGQGAITRRSPMRSKR